MASRLGFTLHHFPTAYSKATSSSSIYGVNKAPRRLVLSVGGAAFWGQLLGMATNVGAKSFIASARQTSAVEQVNLQNSCSFFILGFLFCFDIQFLSPGFEEC